jgi:hypothetical protein
MELGAVGEFLGSIGVIATLQRLRIIRAGYGLYAPNWIVDSLNPGNGDAN